MKIGEMNNKKLLIKYAGKDDSSPSNHANINPLLESIPILSLE